MRRLILASAAATAVLMVSAVASAQKTSANASAKSPEKSATPSGWVGLSVIQKGSSDEGSSVRIGYPIVASVDPGSPAQAAGLVAGDTILAYNDVDASSAPIAVRPFLVPGRELVVKARRNGVRRLTLTVAKRSARNAYREGVTVSSTSGAALPLMYGLPTGPIAIAAPVASDREAAPFAGAYLARLNAGLAHALNVRNSGVLVVDVSNGSDAAKAGLQSGDVITRADSITVESPLGIMTALRLASDSSVTLDVTRRGKSQKVRVRW
ncbi:MAG TPA: PDZ domain-containing protein [Gemmatimonadaceae bacterium]|nr:PDZ domain-containing protein [Gemmatimonadaceae bacterium]